MTLAARRIRRAGLRLAGMAMFALVWPVAAARDVAFESSSLRAPEPMARLQADGAGGLLAVSASGVLWRLDPATANWARLGDGIDPDTPPASGHGRVAARGALGGLWVWEAGRSTVARDVRVAPRAGLLILPLGIVGVTQEEGHAYVARFEPDARRYRHGVLGDAIESTRVLYLERHGLAVMRRLDVPAPHVIEDIAPRPVAWRGGTGLLTMRSGPLGAQLAVVAASPGAKDRLEFAALGPPIGMPNRWMAATTDGRRLLAVHMPHIGGVLHEYRADGAALSPRTIAAGLSNHRSGTRELDLAAWTGALLMLPAQDRTSLRCFDAAAGWSACGSIALGRAVIGSAALALRERAGIAVLTEDGQLTFVVRRR